MLQITVLEDKTLRINNDGETETQDAVFSASQIGKQPVRIESKLNPLKFYSFFFPKIQLFDADTQAFVSFTSAEECVVALNEVIGVNFKSPAGGGSAGDAIESFTIERTPNADGSGETDTFAITMTSGQEFKDTLPVVHGFTMLPQGVNLDLIVDNGYYVYNSQIIIVYKTGSNIYQVNLSIAPFPLIRTSGLPTINYGVWTTRNISTLGTDSSSYTLSAAGGYALNQKIIALQAASAEAISYVDYITLPPAFIELTTPSISVPTTETAIAGLSFTVAEAGNYKGELYLNVNRTQDRRIFVRLRKKIAGQTGLGDIIKNSQRNHFINQSGVITTIYDKFRSQIYLNAGDIITVTAWADGNGLSLVTATDLSYIAAQLIVEKVI